MGEGEAISVGGGVGVGELRGRWRGSWIVVGGSIITDMRHGGEGGREGRLGKVC